MRVPGIVQLRMLLNLAIDLLIGMVPFAGDVADVFWKSNTKNLALLERHAGVADARDRRRLAVRHRHHRASSLAMAALPLLLLYWLATAVPRAGIQVVVMSVSVPRVFLLSPANCGGTRGTQAVAAREFALAERAAVAARASRSARCFRSSADCISAAS